MDCTGVKLDTPPAVLVAPNGYRGFEARIYKCGGHQALSHWEGSKKMTRIDVKANLDFRSRVARCCVSTPATGITKLRKHLQEHDPPWPSVNQRAATPAQPVARELRCTWSTRAKPAVTRPNWTPRYYVSGSGYVGTGDRPAA